jgi:hypothetical protein
MMRRTLVGFIAGLALAACASDDSSTAACPEVPLFDVRDASIEQVQQYVAAAAAAGCVTSPTPPPGPEAGTP